MAQTRKNLRGRVLRKGEAQLMKDQMDGLDIYAEAKGHQVKIVRIMEQNTLGARHQW